MGLPINEVVRKHKEQGYRQPYLLAMTANGEEDATDHLFVILDSFAIRVPGNVSKGVEQLFSVFYAFGIQYPESLVSVYNFFELQFGFENRRHKGKHNPSAIEFSDLISKQILSS